MKRRFRWLGVVASLVLVPLGIGPTLAGELSLLAEEAEGAIAIDGERAVRIEPSTLAVAVRAGPDDRIQFQRAGPEGNSGSARVRVFGDQDVFVVRPEVGEDSPEGVLWVSVPARFDVDVEGAERRVELKGLDGDVRVDGENIDLRGIDLGGSLDVQMRGGTVEIARSGADLELRLDDVSLRLDSIDGAVGLRVSGGTARIADVRGGLDVDLRGCDVGIDGVEGLTTIVGDGGSVRATTLADGAEISVTGTRVDLSEVDGAVRIVTDGPTSIVSLSGPVTLDVARGSIEGRRIAGPLEARLESGSLAVETMLAPATIVATGGRVVIRGAEARLEVDGSDATIEVETPRAEVVLRARGGAVEVRNPFGGVDIESVDADVSVVEARGTITVAAECDVVDVGWAQLPDEGTMVVKNAVGDVIVRLPRGGRAARIDARTVYGEVVSDRREVVVGSDGKSATGALGGGRSGPTLRVEAEGGVRFSTGSAPQGREQAED